MSATSKSVTDMGSPAAEVLVAEDDEEFRRPLVGILEREGYRCTQVQTIAAAAERMRAQRYDLLLADLEMPDGAGCDLIREATGLDVPVIVLTGNPSLSTAMESIRLHVVGYLVKPPNWAEFRELVATTLAASARRRVLESQYQRLTAWSRDLRRLHDSIQARPADAGVYSEHLNHLVNDLSATITELMTAPPTARVAAGGTDQGRLMLALQETISVLEQTKGAFKSKQLGTLRQKLTKLIVPPPEINVPPASPVPPPHPR